MNIGEKIWPVRFLYNSSFFLMFIYELSVIIYLFGSKHAFIILWFSFVCLFSVEMLNIGFKFLLGTFTPDQHLRFLEFYKKLCTLGLQQENGHNENQIPPQILEQEKKYTSVRKNCAYNFPVTLYIYIYWAC